MSNSSSSSVFNNPRKLSFLSAAVPPRLKGCGYTLDMSTGVAQIGRLNGLKIDVFDAMRCIGEASRARKKPASAEYDLETCLEGFRDFVYEQYGCVMQLEINEKAHHILYHDSGICEITGDVETRRATVHVQVLEQHFIHVIVLPDGVMRCPRTWAIAPGSDDCASQGRDRLDVSGFSCPDYRFSLSGDKAEARIETDCLRLCVKLRGFFCTWYQAVEGGWVEIAADRATQNFDWGSPGPSHYLLRRPAECYYGLGERAGPCNRAGRRYELRNVDAMGYNASSSDPLYKHVPFYITKCTKVRGGLSPSASFGLFYDTYSDCAFDFGCERSNYHGQYRSFIATHGDLDYYVIAGPRILDVTRRFTWLTGRPAFMPRWTLGYSGSTMSYTDAPDAQLWMQTFLEKCREHDIACSSFHLSSGYTSIGKRRYVFCWNTDKFPDPAAFIESYARAGVRIIANVKPCLLEDHPLFHEAASLGLFLRAPVVRSSSESAAADPPVALTQWWDGYGALLDFTRSETQQWWKKKVKDSLLHYGIASTWNDNNEYEGARAGVCGFAHMFGAADVPSVSVKPLQTLLMMRTSLEAQKEAAAAAATEKAAAAADGAPVVVTDLSLPRQFLISRSGCAGMQRYVQTWSGDNFTRWSTIKFNMKMGLGLALCGISNAGHDVGGFAGPTPSPELLIRWIASAIFLPRFSIHSWKGDGTVTEPWMYPEALPTIRALLQLRHLLEPYLYTLMWRYSQFYEPVILPTWALFESAASKSSNSSGSCVSSTGVEEEGGEEVNYEEEEDDVMMLGPYLLIAAVVKPACESIIVRTPEGVDWRDFWGGGAIPGGSGVQLSVPLHAAPPLLIRDGSSLPIDTRPYQWAGAAAAAASESENLASNSSAASTSMPPSATLRTFATAAAAWLVFAPLAGGSFTAEAFDDGIGTDDTWKREGSMVRKTLHVEATKESLLFTSVLSSLAEAKSPFDEESITLPSSSTIPPQQQQASPLVLPEPPSLSTLTSGPPSEGESYELEVWLPASDKRAVALRRSPTTADPPRRELLKQGRRVAVW